MRRTVLQALLTLTGIAALAIATSCYSEQSDEFQQLEDTIGTQYKIVDVTSGDSVSANQIYDRQKVAQRFTLSTRTQIQGAFVKLVRTGDWSATYPGAEIRAQIFTNGTGEPSSTTASNSTEAALVDSILTTAPADSTGYIAFEFNIKPTLNVGTYWIVFSMVDNTDGLLNFNYLSYYVNGTGNQVAYFNYGAGPGSWATITGDLAIVLWGKTVP